MRPLGWLHYQVCPLTGRREWEHHIDESAEVSMVSMKGAVLCGVPVVFYMSSHVRILQNRMRFHPISQGPGLRFDSQVLRLLRSCPAPQTRVRWCGSGENDHSSSGLREQAAVGFGTVWILSRLRKEKI